MKKLLLIFWILFSCLFATGQPSDSFYNTSIKSSSVQLELLGNGFAYSVSYEHILINKSKFKTAAQIGVEYLPPNASVDFVLPVQVCQLYSFEKHHLELGIGYSFIFDLWNEEKNKQMSGIFTGRIGYRFQKPDGKFLMRIGFIPLRTHYRSIEGEYYKIEAWGGISFGYAF